MLRSIIDAVTKQKASPRGGGERRGKCFIFHSPWRSRTRPFRLATRKKAARANEYVKRSKRRRNWRKILLRKKEREKLRVFFNSATFSGPTRGENFSSSSSRKPPLLDLDRSHPTPFRSIALNRIDCPRAKRDKSESRNDDTWGKCFLLLLFFL